MASHLMLGAACAVLLIATLSAVLDFATAPNWTTWTGVLVYGGAAWGLAWVLGRWSREE